VIEASASPFTPLRKMEKYLKSATWASATERFRGYGP